MLILDKISQELSRAYSAHTVVLYGSHADGSAGPDSDYDVAAFAPVAEPLRIVRLEQRTFLDLFVYPEALLQTPTAEFLRLRGGKVLLQRDGQGDALLRRIDAIFLAGPTPLPPDESAARKAWAHKMAARIKRRDPEGNYRRAWLLQALLEDFFHIRGLWYEGPKKSLRWLSQFEPAVFAAYCTALEPDASDEAVGSLVVSIAGPEVF